MNANALDEIYRFTTISDFKRSIHWGGEAVIQWQGEEYGIWGETDIIRITHAKYPEKSHIYQTIDEALEHRVGSDRLRDVITKVTVIDRVL